VTPLEQLKAAKRDLIARHVRPDNLIASRQLLLTLVPMGLLWGALALSGGRSPWWMAVLVVPLSLLLVRAFVLMHDCGHGSLFRSPALNTAMGFVLGVLTGMPQSVWSRRHQFHHATNGNWDRYRGPLDIVTVSDFDRLSPACQIRYARQRHLLMAPLAGFLYVVLNPRLNWLIGSARWVRHCVRTRITHPNTTWREAAQSFNTPLWACSAEYGHVCANNLVLLGLLSTLGWAAGWLPVLAVLLSMSLAGALGIVLFTVQHNFEESQACGQADWDYDRAALEGTSLLVLPSWLGWITANIAYHHVHHLSARIPNYRLAACHHERPDLFGQVTRLTLRQIPSALRCILWDPAQQRLIPVATHRSETAAR
jgi:omega-6 fatty acid desaturase (delta-12 desaturase)